MTYKLGARDIVRNFSILDEYGYVEIEDKKTHRLKGAFVSGELLESVREYLIEKAKEKKDKKLDAIMKFAGKIEVDDAYTQKNAKEIRNMIANEKCSV
jgi:hypothetical protein